MLAWDAGGSIRAGDWLAYGALAALVLAVVLFSGSAVRPARLPLIAAALLLGFAAWTAISAAWAPAPSFARDDALLSLAYTIALLTPLVTLRSGVDRVTATAIAVLGLGGLAAWSALYLRSGGDPDVLYLGGRLDFPVTYWNGQAALALIAFWPAIALAARRSLTVVIRALALGAATAMACLWFGTQSKGGGVALAVSAVVVFAVSGSRLRLLVPTAIVAALSAFAARPLTEPFRTDGQAFEDAVRHAGDVTLLLTGIGAVLGLAYGLVDNRAHISARARMWTGRAVLGLVCVAAAAVVVGFFASVDHPLRSAQDRWDDFKNVNSEASASTHFSALGSNRYDFWRVAWDEFERHPIVGIGAYGWGNAYLLHGRSLETPQRSHSVELDALSETGVLGFLLIVGAGVLVLLTIGTKARGSLVASGALGSAAYFAVHTGGDWVWTIPAVGLPAFVIAGIALSEDRSSPLPRRIAVPAGVVAVLAAVFAFSPPWLSARLVQRAYDQPTLAAAQDDLRRARRLDPLAVSPLLAEAALVDSPRDIPLLHRAVAKQPRNAELHFLLGLALVDAGQKEAAARELRTARAMSPRDQAIQGALEEAR
jgi:O-antigen ligase/polysaccharide polymerase Wzy-like membrane protein